MICTNGHQLNEASSSFEAIVSVRCRPIHSLLSVSLVPFVPHRVLFFARSFASFFMYLPFFSAHHSVHRRNLCRLFIATFAALYKYYTFVTSLTHTHARARTGCMFRTNVSQVRKWQSNQNIDDRPTISVLPRNTVVIGTLCSIDGDRERTRE